MVWDCNIPVFVPTRLELFSTAGDAEEFEPLDTLRMFVRYVDRLIAASLEVRAASHSHLMA